MIDTPAAALLLAPSFDLGDDEPDDDDFDDEEPDEDDDDEDDEDDDDEDVETWQVTAACRRPVKDRENLTLGWRPA